MTAWWIELKSDPFIRSGPFQGHIESPKHGPHVGFFCSYLKGHDSLMDTAESDPFVRSGPFQGHIESPKPGPCVVFFLFSSEGHNSSPWASWGLNSQPLGATSNQVSAPLRHSTCLEKCCLCRCVLDLEYNYVLNTLAAVCFLSSWKTDFDSDFDVCRSCFWYQMCVFLKDNGSCVWNIWLCSW